MCEVIEAENLLVAYFATQRKRKVSIGRLKTLRARIESSSEEPVYVDITRSSLVRAVELNAGILDWKGSFIVCLQTPAGANKLDENYNWRIPAPLRSRLMQVVKSA